MSFNSLKIVITSFLLTILISGNIMAQCANDARAIRFKNMNTNVQACSQCSLLAVYFCGAQYAFKPEDIAKYRELIAKVKSNIRYNAPHNCCPEMLKEQPRFGVMGSGSGAGGENNSKSGFADDIASMSNDDWAELGSAVVSGVELGLMTIDVLDQLFPDVSGVYRNSAKKFNYNWTNQTSNGYGTGIIEMADPEYIFEGSIKKGFPKEGKLRLGDYGLYNGKFNTSIDATKVLESDISGGNPTIGIFQYNFGVENQYLGKPEDPNDFSFLFDNEDRMSIIRKGIKKYVVYHSKENNETYTLKFKYLKEREMDDIRDDLPIDDPIIKENIARYFMATCVRTMCLPKMLGRDMENWWWQKLLDDYIEGMKHFTPSDNAELQFWKEKIMKDSKYS